MRATQITETKEKIITVLKQLRGFEYTPRKQNQRLGGNKDVNKRYENGIKYRDRIVREKPD